MYFALYAEKCGRKKVDQDELTTRGASGVHVMRTKTGTKGLGPRHQRMVRHDKRSIVKHKTRGTEPHKKGGFHVGATNMPNGAYIGRAKKHKEELIHKAKVKKAYYKMLEKEKEAAPVEAPTFQDVGRFVSENEHEQSTTPRPAPESEPSKRKKKLPYFYTPPKQPRERAQPQRTREQALDEREARRKLWNRKSPSRLGRERGQPDLGARMQVMLNKIQRG